MSFTITVKRMAQQNKSQKSRLIMHVMQNRIIHEGQKKLKSNGKLEINTRMIELDENGMTSNAATQKDRKIAKVFQIRWKTIMI